MQLSVLIIIILALLSPVTLTAGTDPRVPQPPAQFMPQEGLLTVNAGGDQVVCGGVKVSFEGSAAGGTEPYHVSWSPGQGMSDSTSFTPSLVATTTTSYILTITDADDSVVTDTLVVTVNPQVVLTSPDTVDVCKGSPATITVNVTGGTGNKSYTWNINGIETVTAVNIFTFTPTASVDVGLLVVDAKGCNASDNIYVRVNNRPVVTLTGPEGILCAEDNSVLRANVKSGTAPYTFEWASKDGVFSANPDSIVVSPDSSNTYRLTVTDAKGCTDTASVFLAVHDIQMALSTDNLNLPNLGACQTTEDVWITVFNNGSEPFTIDSVRGTYTTTTSKDYPLTVPPFSSHILPLKLTLPNTSPIRDTLIFAENVCKKLFPVLLTGVRGAFTAVQADTSVDGPVVLACGQATSATIEVNLDNQATKSATVTKAVSSSGALVTIHGAPVVVAAKAKATIQVTILGPVDEGANTDTLTMTYTSDACVSNLSVPMHYLGEAVQLTLPTELVFNDSVSQALEDVSKPLEFTPTFVGLTHVELGAVVVTGPFSTALTTGTPITSGVPVVTSVTFHPSQMSADGAVTGVMSITIGECADAYSIDLKAQRTVVSVDEEKAEGTLTCWLAGDVLRTQPEDIGVVVYDLRGNIVARRLSGSRDVILFSKVAPGAYAVVLEGGQTVHVATVMYNK